MRVEIIDALESLKDEKKIKAVIFYGGEEGFSAGFDRDEIQAVVQGLFLNRRSFYDTRLIRFIIRHKNFPTIAPKDDPILLNLIISTLSF